MLQKPVELIYLLAMSNSHQELVTYVERSSGIAVLESLKTFAPAAVMNTLILQSDEDFFIWYMSSTEFRADDQTCICFWERSICCAIEYANLEALLYLLLSFGKKFGTCDFGFFSQQTQNHNTDWCNSYVLENVETWLSEYPGSIHLQERLRNADREISVCFILKQLSDPAFMRTRSWRSAMKDLRFPKFVIY
jgi:hypothetical protein